MTVTDYVQACMWCDCDRDSWFMRCCWTASHVDTFT